MVYDSNAFQILGSTSMVLGQYERAFESLKAALSIDPKNLKVNHQFGVLYDRMGQYEKAIPFYKAAIEIDANFADAHLDLAIALDQMELFEEAIKEYEEVLRLGTDDIEVYFRLGLLYDSFMDAENAMRHTIRAQELAEEKNEKVWLANTKRSVRILSARYGIDPKSFQGKGHH